MIAQALNTLPVAVEAFLVHGSATTLLVEGAPAGCRLEFTSGLAPEPVEAFAGVMLDEGVTGVRLSASEVDRLIDLGVEHVRIVAGDGDAFHVLAGGPVWVRPSWQGTGSRQLMARVIAGPSSSSVSVTHEGDGLYKFSGAEIAHQGDGVYTIGVF